LCLDAANKQSYTGSGTVWTDLAGSNNGTLTNGPTFSNANAGSIVFDGSNDYVNITGSPSINISGDYTVEVWVNIESISSDPVITSKWSTDPKSMYIGFYPPGNISHFRTLANNAHYNASFVFTSENIVGKWNQIVAITSGSTVQIGNNGEIKGSAFWPGVDNAPNTSLLVNGFGGQVWPGKVSTTRVYNRALSPTEILQNYNATKGRYNL
jgi:hypothetical protein